jgi:pimeloyl-ACP methyl ester carboxylesterase
LQIDFYGKRVSTYVSVPYALAMTAADEKDFFAFRDANPAIVRDVPLESVANSLLHFRPDLYCGAIPIPDMILHGTGDEIVPIRQAYAIKSKIKSKCELVVLEGAPHPLPMSSFAAEVFAHAARWFDQNL